MRLTESLKVGQYLTFETAAVHLQHEQPWTAVEHLLWVGVRDRLPVVQNDLSWATQVYRENWPILLCQLSVSLPWWRGVDPRQVAEEGHAPWSWQRDKEEQNVCWTGIYSIYLFIHSFSWTDCSPRFHYWAVYLVSNAKNPCAQHCFGCTIWNPTGNFLDQQLIMFAHENHCNCASRGTFGADEFFKCAYEISKSRQHKRIFDGRKWTLRGQFRRHQHTIRRPKLPK